MIDHPRIAGRWQQSVALTVGQFAVAVLNAFPGLVYPKNPLTTAIVLHLASIGPIWIAWFGLTGVALTLGLVSNRGLHLAHLATGSAWIGFAFALEVGAIALHGTHILPLACLILATVHFNLAASYSRDLRAREGDR